MVKFGKKFFYDNEANSSSTIKPKKNKTKKGKNKKIKNRSTMKNGC